MKTTLLSHGKRGYVSYSMVLSIGVILTIMMIYAYRSASRTRALQADVQLHNDYLSKEDAVLRYIIAIAPNRAMRAMQGGSSASTSVSQRLRWENIFSDALTQANARTSIPTNMRTSLNLTNSVVANSGDSGLATTSRMFRGIGSENTVFAATGLNRTLGNGFPPALSSVDNTVNTNDRIYPIISNSKVYGSLASGRVGLPVATYPNFNLITYPNINFGYLRPGDSLVAKRNWWAFNLDLAANDTAPTGASRFKHADDF
ncbi:MAG: hypothetical protein CFE26_11710, partial [Verrucomicrobiales bacterium VVV1]